MNDLPGPALFPRIWSERDELGYPLLNHECPFCSAMALIINEWDAIECLAGQPARHVPRLGKTS